MAEIFRRREIKYRLDETRLPGILEEISRHAVPDAYNADGREYGIVNLYMDTPDDWFIRRSLRGPRYKEKLRLRGYGGAVCNGVDAGGRRTDQALPLIQGNSPP